MHTVKKVIETVCKYFVKKVPEFLVLYSARVQDNTEQKYVKRKPKFRSFQCRTVIIHHRKFHVPCNSSPSHFCQHFNLHLCNFYHLSILVHYIIDLSATYSISSCRVSYFWKSYFLFLVYLHVMNQSNLTLISLTNTKFLWNKNMETWVEL